MAAGGGQKLAHVETIRGLACVLLVAFHVVGNDPVHGMRIPAHDPWSVFIELFSNVRMPLFTFISGLVFAVDPRTFEGWRQALVKKLRRLALPLISVSTLFWIALVVVESHEAPPLHAIYWLSFEHFWFLQATILIMTVLLTLGLVVGGGQRAAFILMPIAVVMFLAAPEYEPDVFSVNQAFFLAPFFLAGYLTRSLGWDRGLLAEGPLRPWLVAGFGILVAGLLAADLAVLTDHLAMDFARQSVAGLILGLSSCLFLLTLRPVVPFLAWIGAHSYAIYLFHVFFTSGTRISIGYIHPDAPRIEIFLAALAAGVFMPMLVSRALLTVPAAAFIFLGVDVKRRQPASRVPAGAPLSAN